MGLWATVGVPFSAFIVALIPGLGAFIYTLNTAKKWRQNNAGEMRLFFIRVLSRHLVFWVLLLGVAAASHFSILASNIQSLIIKSCTTTFIISFTALSIELLNGIIKIRIGASGIPRLTNRWILIISSVILGFIAALVILEIWGISNKPAFIGIVALLFVFAISTRDYFPNLVAGVEIAYTGKIKLGNMIRLDTGESGEVVEISHINTSLKTADGNLIIVPNSKLAHGIIINYGVGPSSEKVISASKSPLDVLTERETEVLISVGKGATNREIADQLVLSEHTVKSHIRSILGKLNIKNRQQAAVFAQKEGLVAYEDSSEKSAPPSDHR